jgi:hypothetical protein
LPNSLVRFLCWPLPTHTQAQQTHGRRALARWRNENTNLVRSIQQPRTRGMTSFFKGVKYKQADIQLEEAEERLKELEKVS